ncbi:MAG: hypothetical protein ACE14S_09495 [Candidatus Bathyarchaeia archaeon]
MSLTDIPKVLYAPHKAFKNIVQNPKYLGVVIALLVFVAAQTAFYYSFYSQNLYEQTAPSGADFGEWTQNATMWTTSSGAAISQNALDTINNTFLGNSSLQFDASNSNALSMELASFGADSSVDCNKTGYTLLSARVKLVEPQSLPSKITLYLYSESSSNYFQYDLTSAFSNSTVGVWNNLTVPVGPEASGWQSSGSPAWNKITGLKLDFAYSTSSSITVRAEGVFFRGNYQTQMAIDSTGFILSVLQLVFVQFLFEWLIFTALMYIVIKALKGNVIWKPLFVAIGFALVVLAIQAVINVAATSTMPLLHYPVELLAGVPVEAEAASNAIIAARSTFDLVTGVVQLSVYVWIVALGAFVVRALLPEFSRMKSIVVSAVALIVSVILLRLLIGV